MTLKVEQQPILTTVPTNSPVLDFPLATTLTPSYSLLPRSTEPRPPLLDTFTGAPIAVAPLLIGLWVMLMYAVAQGAKESKGCGY